MPQTKPQSLSSRRRDLQKWLRRCCLFDDAFLCKCFEQNPLLVQFILRIMLEMPDLQVQECFSQHFMQNLQGRSVCFDILAVDASGKQYNIEIQRTDSGAHVKRARYNSSILDAAMPMPGEQYHTLRDSYVIFLTEKDPLRQGLPVCHVERVITETGQSFGDGSHMIYASARFQDDTPLGRLMRDFTCPDPAQMYYPLLADNVRHFKQTEEGVNAMSSVFEEFALEVIDDYSKETALRMLEDDSLPLEKIALYTDLTVAEVQALAAQKESA